MAREREKKKKTAAKQNETKEEAMGDGGVEKKNTTQCKTKQSELHFQPQDFPTFTSASGTSGGAAGFLIYITYRGSDRC